MDYLYYLFVVCGFLAVVLALEGGFVIWNTYRGPEAQRIEKRLRSVSAGGPASEQTFLLKQRVMSELPALDRLLMQMPRLKFLDRLMQQAGSDMTVAMLIGMSVLMAIIGLFIPMLLKLPGFFAPFCAIACASLPFLHLFLARQTRLREFEKRLPDALDLISRSLRAGHSFPSGLEMVATEGAEPVASEFRAVADEINFGISVQEALMNLVRRVPSTDLSYFVVSVLIQRETGGNLAELLDKLSGLIRQRFRLFEKVRALSAEGKLSAWILCILPFFVAALINVINPKFLHPLWDDPLGFRFVVGALVFMVLGVLWMWRIIKIRV